MNFKVFLIGMLLTTACLAEECFDYKKDDWRMGKMRCGTSCYECDSEDNAKEDLKRECEKYFHVKIPVVNEEKQ